MTEPTMAPKGQTDRGYKKPELDFSNLLFVSFNRNRIFQIAIRLGIKRIQIIRYCQTPA